MSNQNLTLSIIILTKNRSESLSRCLDSITNSKTLPESVVVYDNSSSRSNQNRNQKLTNSYKNKVKIIYHSAASTGIAEMRNKAISLSDSNIIMSLDDDCQIDETAIGKIINAFKKNNQLGILGAQINNIGFEGKDQYKGRGKLGPNGQYLSCPDQSKADFFGSATMSIRRSSFDQVNGYDNFFTSALEEADLLVRIKRAGYKVEYHPEVIINHYNERQSNKIKPSIIKPIHARLYFYFKNFHPKDFNQWISFFATEFNLLKQLYFPTKTQAKVTSKKVKSNPASKKNISIRIRLMNAFTNLIIKPGIHLYARVSFIPIYLTKVLFCYSSFNK